jgi:hypothetical protein
VEDAPLPIPIGKHKRSTRDPLFISEVEGDNGSLPGHQLN